MVAGGGAGNAKAREPSLRGAAPSVARPSAGAAAGAQAMWPNAAAAAATGADEETALRLMMEGAAAPWLIEIGVAFSAQLDV